MGGDAPAGKAAVTFPYSKKQLTDVVDGLRENNVRLKNLLALTDDLLAAVDAGEPVSGQLARLEEMNAVAAAAEERAGVIMRTYFAMRRAFIEAKAQASRETHVDCAGQSDAATTTSSSPEAQESAVADVDLAGGSNPSGGSSGAPAAGP